MSAFFQLPSQLHLSLILLGFSRACVTIRLDERGGAADRLMRMKWL